MLEAALQLGRARRVLAAPDGLVLAAHERALAPRTVRRHLPSAAPRSARSGFTTRTTCGMMSPAFSTMTRSPSRMSFRATSLALCSVAIDTVVPAMKTGSSTANGVTAPVRPTLMSIFRKRRFRLLGRKLEGDRPSRKFRRRAEPRRAARSSSSLMTTPSVSKASTRVAAERFSPHSRQYSATSSMPVERLPVRLDGQSPGLRGSRAARDACQASPSGADQLVAGTRAVHASSPAPDRVCASRPTRRCADWRSAARPPLRAPRWCARTPCAADRPRRGSRSCPSARRASVCGMSLIVRTLAVTSSPVMPSPRVAPRTSRPSRYCRAMLRPSIFSSAT